MDLLWFVETTDMDNEASRDWMKECHTPMSLQEGPIRRFSEATAVLWLAEGVLFRRLKQGRSMFALRCKVETLCCSLILFVRIMKCGWHSPVWPGKKSYAWVYLGLISHGMLTGVSRVNWTFACRVFALSCLMGGFWPQFVVHIQGPPLQTWLRSEKKQAFVPQVVPVRMELQRKQEITQ